MRYKIAPMRAEPDAAQARPMQTLAARPRRGLDGSSSSVVLEVTGVGTGVKIWVTKLVGGWGSRIDVRVSGVEYWLNPIVWTAAEVIEVVVTGVVLMLVVVGFKTLVIGKDSLSGVGVMMMSMKE